MKTHWMLIWIVLLTAVDVAGAGMPAPLPTPWTKDHELGWAPTQSGSAILMDSRWQAISFFVVCLLVCVWLVKFLWTMLRQNLTWLPELDYRRSFSLVVLWGLLFVIVLTMISGARELMTPGAWRKQGWTYKLVHSPADGLPPRDSRAARRAGLEQLRLGLWQYAATHEGRFPDKYDPAIDPRLWQLPGWPGMKYLMVSGRVADDAGQLLLFEPELENDERQVLLTNGFIGTMRTDEIQRALSGRERP